MRINERWSMLQIIRFQPSFRSFSTHLMMGLDSLRGLYLLEVNWIGDRLVFHQILSWLSWFWNLAAVHRSVLGRPRNIKAPRIPVEFFKSYMKELVAICYLKNEQLALRATNMTQLIAYQYLTRVFNLVILCNITLRKQVSFQLMI